MGFETLPWHPSLSLLHPPQVRPATASCHPTPTPQPPCRGHFLDPPWGPGTAENPPQDGPSSTGALRSCLGESDPPWRFRVLWTRKGRKGGGFEGGPCSTPGGEVRKQGKKKTRTHTHTHTHNEMCLYTEEEVGTHNKELRPDETYTRAQVTRIWACMCHCHASTVQAPLGLESENPGPCEACAGDAPCETPCANTLGSPCLLIILVMRRPHWVWKALRTRGPVRRVLGMLQAEPCVRLATSRASSSATKPLR